VESRGLKSSKSLTQTVANHEIIKFRWKSPTQTISTCRH